MGKKENTKEKIIEATVRLALTVGFANIRTAEIAKEAGISEGLIYKYFPSKGHLLSVIFTDTFRRLQSGIEEIIEDDSLTPTKKLISFIDFHFHFFTIDRNIVQLIYGHSDKKCLNVNIGEIVEYGVKSYSRLVARILEEGIRAGEFRVLNSEVVSLAVLGTIQVSLLNAVLFNPDPGISNVKSSVTEFILAGVKVG